jgi:predicted regulator of Ras-like GTPase activity (Roadblock/LC7/MglB family)
MEVMVFEADGFVVYTSTSGASHPSDASVEAWKELLTQTGPEKTVTLVQENGYVMLSALPIGTLVVKAKRTANLGALRQSLATLQAELNTTSS